MKTVAADFADSKQPEWALAYVDMPALVQAVNSFVEAVDQQQLESCSTAIGNETGEFRPEFLHSIVYSCGGEALR
eukprot:SAG11_NODE_654_length_7909_cov_7.701280_10_plen_75_part_00